MDLRFLLPESEELSPANTQLAEITLVTSVPEEGRRSESRTLESREEYIDLGRIPVGEGIQLAVELRSPTRRLIGYGRGPGPIDVRPGQGLEVPMRVRRPFAYVATPNGVATFDTTQDARVSGYRGSIPLPRAPSVVIPTWDGAELVALASTGSGGQLSLVSTSTHEPVDVPPVPLERPPSEAAVSIDNRHVVVGHDGANGGITIVDLAAARRGEAVATFVPLGAVGAVALDPAAGPDSPGRAFALLERADAVGCPLDASNSTIIGVSLADPSAVGPTISFDSPIHDVAASSNGTLVVADGCNEQLERIDPDDDARRDQLAELSRASAVAILDDRVWGAGSLAPQDGEGARVILLSVDVDGGGEKRDELAALQERAVSPGFSDDGQRAINTLDADELWPYDLAVAPGADNVALLTWAYYHGQEVGDFFGQPIIPEMWIDTYEYHLVDASTGGVAQRLRSDCILDFEVDPNAPPIIADWRCGSAPDQDVAEATYEPVQLSVLYGGR